eukprot:3250149-Prymnesium_polylepis.1
MIESSFIPLISIYYDAASSDVGWGPQRTCGFVDFPVLRIFELHKFFRLRSGLGGLWPMMRRGVA